MVLIGILVRKLSMAQGEKPDNSKFNQIICSYFNGFKPQSLALGSDPPQRQIPKPTNHKRTLNSLGHKPKVSPAEMPQCPTLGDVGRTNPTLAIKTLTKISTKAQTSSTGRKNRVHAALPKVKNPEVTVKWITDPILNMLTIMIMKIPKDITKA